MSSLPSGETAPLAPGDRFPNLTLLGPDGQVDLQDRWRAQPLVVTFMRHFGCAFCREHLGRLGGQIDTIRGEGADVIAIFGYGAQATDDFCSSRKVPFDCLGDPERLGYGAVTLGRGSLRQLLGWRVLRRYREASAAGGGSGLPQGGDMAQLPGTFVVGTDGRLVFAHYGANSADNPPIDAVVEAVRGADGGAQEAVSGSPADHRLGS